MCECGRGPLPPGYSACIHCHREARDTPKPRTKDQILTDLARAQNIGDHEGQRKYQAEYDRMRRGVVS